MPFAARLFGVVVFTAGYLVAWRRLRPSTAQNVAALLAGVAVAAYDWAGEVWLYDRGVWVYQGGIQALGVFGATLDFRHVPMEMPLGFIPGVAAMCLLLLVPHRLAERGSPSPLAGLRPASACAGLVAVTLVVGPIIDSTYNPWTGSVVYRVPWSTVMAYVVPFWGFGALLALGVDALVLKAWPGSPSPFRPHPGPRVLLAPPTPAR